MQVLTVEDDPIQQRLIAHTLKVAGCNVATAKNGLDAYEIIHRYGYGVVVSDWDMPGANGVELCRKLRLEEHGENIYFILLTSRSSPGERQAALEAGVDYYMTKPFSPEKLIQQVSIGRFAAGLASQERHVFALAQLAESRDPTLGLHLDRVRNYCRIIAQHLQTKQPEIRGVNDSFVDLIYRASPLHDIGNLAIPKELLRKPGRVTAGEFEVLKTHTLHGAVTLQADLDDAPNVAFLQMAREIVLSHHERFDGSGYPYHLRGNEIPLAGRIVALADVYDALTSQRSYKDPVQLETARELIQRGAGREFDPAIVQAFLECESQFIETHQYYDNKQLKPKAALSLDM